MEGSQANGASSVKQDDPDLKALFNLDFWWKKQGFGVTLWKWGVDFQLKLRGRTWTVNKGTWPTPVT